MRIEQVLFEYGQAVQPMRSAPRDGTSILAFAQDRGTIIGHWPNDRPVSQDRRGWKITALELDILIGISKAGLIRGHLNRLISSV